ncbi:MAG: FAD-dependent monooxygenase, partial [Desulfuromonadales bacterium]|nr:FAD-dependent monooxygenase [Desulfuromonadales bacterium]
MLPSGAPYFIFRNLQLNLNDDEKLLHDKLCNKIGVLKEEIHSLKILRKGIDARKKHSIKKVYTVSFSAVNYEEFWQNHTDNPSIELIYPSKPLIFTPVKKNKKITVVGSGPAGLFAALRLLEYGLPVLILERGKVIEERVQDVQNFWGKGILNEESNIQFGEGGAGTFSDGKLTTRVRDKNISYVL